MFPRVSSRQHSPWFVAKTYHAERLKRYPRDKNVYHDHDNCPELNPLHEMANQSHSEGTSLPSPPTVQMCHLSDPTGFLLSSTLRTAQDALGEWNIGRNQPRKLLELELRLRRFT